MNVGDLVVYRNPQVLPPGHLSKRILSERPYAIVLQKRPSNHAMHERIRVMWLGIKVPVQAHSFSVSGRRITTWVSSTYFEVVNTFDDEDKK